MHLLVSPPVGELLGLKAMSPRYEGKPSAYLTARYARRAFLAQSKEVSDQAKMLQVQSDQLAEQRKINALQAEDLEESLIISWHLGTMPKGQRYLTPLMPGAEDEDTQPVPPGADADKFGAVAFFRDAAGVTWRTRPDGQLDEIPAGQEPPHTW